MTRFERPPRDFPALDRLAQTRAEITDLIAPNLAYPDADDLYDASAQAAADRSGPWVDDKSLNRAAQQQAERDAVAAWASDAAPSARRPRRPADPRAGSRARAAGAPAGPRSIWGQLLRHGASVWWQRHPAHAAVSVAGSALSHVAIRKPYMMLGLAAGFGALLMLIRPWRLVSLTGLVIAALKMSDLRGLFGSIRRGG